MKSLFLILLSILILCTSFTYSSGGEKLPGKEAIKNRIEEWKGSRPYWENRYYPYTYPHSYPYPYYPYPPPPYLRYEESRRSPYDSLEVKQAGRLSIVVQPFDANVFVDGYQLKQREDLTYEIGLLTGVHKVEAKKEGYKPYSIEVVVEAGRVIPLAIELKKGKPH